MASLAELVRDYLKGEDYVIKAGESFAAIANRHGMTEQLLWNYEGGTDKKNSDRIAGSKPSAANKDEVIRVPKLSDSITATKAEIALPSDMTTSMERLFEKSIAMQNKTICVAPGVDSEFNLIHMDQKALEHGGTCSWILASKKLGIFRTGAGTAGTFSADTSRTAGHYILGDFHTHPYTRFTDGDDNADCAFSGADIRVTIGWTVFFDMVQSGKTVYLCMRTKKTPRDSASNAENDYDAEFSSVRNAQRAAKKRLTRETFQEACYKAAERTCTDYHLAFYAGRGSKLKKRN